MHSADYAVARCPFVHSSVTCRYSVETAKHVIKLFSFFSPSGSHTNDTILVFPYQVVYGNVSTGTAASGAKIFIFGQYLAFGSMTDGASNVVNSFEHGKLYHSKC